MKPLPPCLPSPKNVDPSMWVDESIWCHRLHDEQTPWLTFLEFLNVFFFEDSKNRGFVEPDGPNTLRYLPAKRLYLRNILFNNPKIDDLRFSTLSDSEKWAKCFEELSESPGLIAPQFDYLSKHFSCFNDFWEVISILRSTSLEISSNKRWSSKFVFPYGKDCLFEDLDAKGKTNDRRFFGRSGEVLYLMLCRSKVKNQILPLLKNVFSEDQTMNNLGKCLQPAEEDFFGEGRANAYLPYLEHQSFDLLGEDWLALLTLEMPGFDKFPHLVNLAGFHLLYYQQMVSHQFLELKAPPKIVCEILAQKKTLVRELSIESYHKNNFLPAQAIENFIAQLQASPEWQEAVKTEGSFQKCRGLLKEKAKWEEEEYLGPPNPDSLLIAFREAAIKRHRQHVANIHRVYGREIGLISKRGTNKLRYSPNDIFLKTLIFANVGKRMELHQFLQKVFERYGLIFSDRQAEAVFEKGELDKKAFQGNVERLEQRLASLGFLRRLSDGCAYIVNPYFRKKNDEK